MSILIALLFLPAIGLFIASAVCFARATGHVRHDKRWTDRLNFATWLSEYRTRTSFDDTGQRFVRAARRYRRWFLRYCLFLLLVLLATQFFGSGTPE
ncbi:MAG: hypothetical protein ACE368_03380 [Paracoccaceae bacterium]